MNELLHSLRVRRSPPTLPVPGAVFVYDLSLRLWHWLVTACVTVLAVSGITLGSPPMWLLRSDPLLFGQLAAAHTFSGQVLAVALVARGYWVLAGGSHVKAIYTVPLRDPMLRSDLLWQVKLYLHLTTEPRKLAGQNPLARFTMFGLFVVTGLVLAITGLAMLGAGRGPESWQAAGFGWVFRVLGSFQAVRLAHHRAMYVMVFFVVSHVNAVLRAESLGPASVLSTMLSGWRLPRAPRS